MRRQIDRLGAQNEDIGERQKERAEEASADQHAEAANHPESKGRPMPDRAARPADIGEQERDERPQHRRHLAVGHARELPVIGIEAEQERHRKPRQRRARQPFRIEKGEDDAADAIGDHAQLDEQEIDRHAGEKCQRREQQGQPGRPSRVRNVELRVQAPRVAVSHDERLAQREVALGVARIEIREIEPRIRGEKIQGAKGRHDNRRTMLVECEPAANGRGPGHSCALIQSMIRGTTWFPMP